MISCDEIRQRTVIDAAGLVIGDVVDVLLDPATWRVDGFRVQLRREVTDRVGAPRSLFRKSTIDVPTTAVQSIGDTVLLDVRAEELREISYMEEGRVQSAH